MWLSANRRKVLISKFHKKLPKVIWEKQSRPMNCDLLITNLNSAFVSISIGFSSEIWGQAYSSPCFLTVWTTVIANRNHFCLYQQNHSSASKVTFRQVSNPSKRVFEAPKLAYDNKTKEPVTSQKLLQLFTRLLVNI